MSLDTDLSENLNKLLENLRDVPPFPDLSDLPEELSEVLADIADLSDIPVPPELPEFEMPALDITACDDPVDDPAPDDSMG